MNEPYYFKGVITIVKGELKLDSVDFLKDLEQVFVRHNIDNIRSNGHKIVGFDNDGNFGITNGTILIDNGLDRLKERFRN